MRSEQWYSGHDRNAFIHRAWMRRGLPRDAFDGKPQIALCTTASDLSPCNNHLGSLVERAKAGVWQAGGVPQVIPVPSLGETQLRPTAMLFRNLAAMTIEELIRANPVDGVLLFAGCDKTIPASLMGAFSVGLPTVLVAGGPMLTGQWRGAPLGCGTDVWRLSEEVRAGTLSQQAFEQAESAMIRSDGHCNTMGTASTMACVAEAIGMTMPGNAGIPAPDSRLRELAQHAGRRIVAMVEEDLRPSAVVTRASLLNAIRVVAAIGGSTNAVVHLLALAGRLDIPLDLEDFDRAGREIPLLVNLQPSGTHLMEDFYRAGGLAAVLHQLRDVLDPEAITVTGRPLLDIEPSESWDRDVIRTRDEPLVARAGIAVLRGNLCPDGAVIKPSAATPALMEHRGRAVVFDSIEDFRCRIDDPELDVDADSVLVLRGCGPKGYPGMPEVANTPLPRKLLEQGVRDMVRISDGRMSGTAYGTVVLHVAPESAAGGPLALVRTGDFVELSVSRRLLRVELSEEELSARRASAPEPPPLAARGWSALYVRTVLQADQGADLDFLVGASGDDVGRESH